MTNNKFIVIEIDILNNKDLTNTDKLLYGYIVALSQNEKGCCFMKTSGLASLLNVNKRSIYYSLKNLKKFNYISCTVIKNKRYITPTINKFIKEREDNNKKVELFDYDWLNDN